MSRGKRYRTNDSLKPLKIFIIIPIIVITIFCVKFKFAYEVTLAGETIGYVINKDVINEKISNYMNDTSGNIAYREIDNLPEYKIRLVTKDTNINDEKVLSEILKNVTTTYKAYAVRFNGEQKALINNQEEADSLVNELTNDLNEEIDVNMDIVEVYTTDLNTSSQEEAKNTLNELKVEKVEEYEIKKAEEEKARKAAEELARKEAEEKKAREAQEAIANAPVAANTWQLEIPKIGLTGPIVEGTTPEVINLYIGHFTETVRDNGNVGLAAHNGGYTKNYFANVKNLEINDLLYYSYNGVKKEYAVVSKDIIADTDWSKLGYTSDERLTLITCVDGNTEIRLCVQAVRTK